MLWRDILSPFWQSPQGQILKQKTEETLSIWWFAPRADQIYEALRLTAFDDIRVVILGQDPYHTPGVANGLAFSITPPSKIPPSLKNIFTELKTDLGIQRTNGDLSDWAKQWILLLNTTLTVKLGEPMSHAHLGWSQLTDHIIDTIARDKNNVIFVLWGSHAQSKAPLIKSHKEKKHTILTSPHPSPLSAHRGFFGSKPFSQINELLISSGNSPISW